MLLGGFHPPTLVLSGGVGGGSGGACLFKLTFRLHHMALMSRMSVLPLEPLASDHFQVEFLCHLEEKTHFLLESHPSRQSLSLAHLTSADADFTRRLLASV